MKRRDLIRQTVAGAIFAQGLTASQADPSHDATSENTRPEGRPAANADETPRRPRGEWPLPGQNSRYLAQAELPCHMPHAPKATWSLDLGRVPIVGAISADVDDDGVPEILYGAFPLVCTSLAGKEKWRCDGGEVIAITDIDGDGIAEIAVTLNGALVIGSVRDGKWTERVHVEGCRLWHTLCPVGPERLGEAFRLQQRPVALGKGKTLSWVCTRAATHGHAASLVLLTAKPGGAFSVTEHSMKGLQEMQILAATPDRLIATTGDGKLGVVSTSGKFDSQWPCGTQFVSEPAVADIDGDGINEVVVCKGGGRVAALRTARGSRTPKQAWDVEGSGLLASVPAPFPTPLIADVNGDGKKEILVVANGIDGSETRLLDHRGQTLWKSEISGERATFADFKGDGHLDVYLAAWTPVPHSIGTTLQSYALDGHTGKLLWHNDGSAKIVWHHQKEYR